MPLLKQRWVLLLWVVIMAAWSGNIVLAQTPSPRTITITIRDDYTFSPDEITLYVGEPVVITLINSSPVAQNLRVRIGSDEYQIAQDVPAGASGTLTLPAPQTVGQFEFWSPIDDYREAYLLEGTIYVQQAGTPGTPTSTATATPTPTGTTTPGTPLPTATGLGTRTPTPTVTPTRLPVTATRFVVVATPVSRAPTQRVPATGGPLAPALISLMGMGVLGSLLFIVGRLLRKKSDG